MCCSDFDYFWYSSSATAAVRNNASVKFVAHSEGEIRLELTTGLERKSTQKLVPFLLTNFWTAIVDIYSKNSTIVSADMNFRVPVM